MADWHGYIGIENLGLSASQKQTLITGLAALGPAQSERPAWLNHRRVRLDNDAAIFEALFDDSTLTVAAIKQRLATIFGVAVGTISHTTSTASFGGGTTDIVVFTYNSVQRLRMARFGGTGSTREQSRLEVLGYLAANRDAWEL